MTSIEHKVIAIQYSYNTDNSQESKAWKLRLINSLFKSKKKLYPIKLVHNPTNSFRTEFLFLRINQIDLEIKDISKEIFQAQLLRYRSIFSKESNFLISLQRKYLEASAIKSADWHKQKLIELIEERRVLKVELNRLTGKVWGELLKKNCWNIAIGLAFLMSILIVILIILATIYSLPIFLFLIISYLIINKSS